MESASANKAGFSSSADVLVPWDECSCLEKHHLRGLLCLRQLQLDGQATLPVLLLQHPVSFKSDQLGQCRVKHEKSLGSKLCYPEFVSLPYIFRYQLDM